MQTEGVLQVVVQMHPREFSTQRPNPPGAEDRLQNDSCGGLGVQFAGDDALGRPALENFADESIQRCEKIRELPRPGLCECS